MTALRQEYLFHRTRWLVELGVCLLPGRRAFIQTVASSFRSAHSAVLLASRLASLRLTRSADHMKRSFMKASGRNVNTFRRLRY
jgi:hypothetical protein